ncbi:hypothetical protein PHLCEN_2v4195 [Hermanssonia centrifuga]|uniref:BZIP domain-containing protein n=1 Tax=Hermanssonia centrifuga TaxID=98765 RepID=A0A2R6PZK7_9APHY|nr:hypothetical protein PHLCEN_2v4195 [Hermanssonia centrifuga]
MAPSNLQGLNIVHTAPPQNPYLSDHDLLSVPPFPDLSAQLDLWTNLNFQSDEPLISRKDAHSQKRRGSVTTNDDVEDGDRYNMSEEELQNTGKVAETQSHENVVTGTIIPPQPAQAQGGGPHLPPFDIGSILAGFGIDPFQMPSSVSSIPPPAVTPSLAQLLSFHSAAPMRPLTIPTSQPATQTGPSQPSTPVEQATNVSYPAPKRARTSRSSISESPSEVTSPISPDADETPSTTPLTAAEDKRRRNTAASARFRLKKKEREAALEKKAKELEVRVSELEKECEALRRENGWLKGLVVGVTGAGAVQQQQTGAGMKRGRDELEGHAGQQA